MSATPGRSEHDIRPPVGALPVTGHPAIDAALAAMDLGDDVHTHVDAFAAAHAAVQNALNPPDQPQPPHP
ncbi:MAG: hypothetical protein IPL36_08745 [Nigerium sp.]|nr:hypothetical protein [Nigerium sp.]